MRFVGLTVVLALPFALAPTAFAQQQCGNCDCYHLPVSDECEQCCAHVAGDIEKTSQTTLVLRTTTPPTKESQQTTFKDRTFKVSAKTRKNAELKVGAQATVYYRKSDDTAEIVNIADALSGLLTPGDEPDLPNDCDVSPGALKLYMGKSLLWTARDAFTAVLLNGIPLLSLRRVPTGLAISARVMSDNGKYIAEVVDNQFFVNRKGFFEMRTPDKHTLEVYGKDKEQVLKISYLNKSSIRVSGIFRSGCPPPFVVNDAGITWGTNHLDVGCIGNFTTGFALGAPVWLLKTPGYPGYSKEGPCGTN
jgi:hypothetical protein